MVIPWETIINPFSFKIKILKGEIIMIGIYKITKKENGKCYIG